MGRAVREVLGDSKPIGGSRGSCWNGQDKRRTLPFAPCETLAKTNDVNQIPNSWAEGAGFTESPVQEEALRFTCDVLRGSGAELMIAEADRMDGNMREMDPPAGPPHLDEDQYNDPEFQTSIRDRAIICFERGVSFLANHWEQGDLDDWPTGMSDIAYALTHRPPIAEKPAIFAPAENMAAAIAYWRGSEGGTDFSVPVVFRRQRMDGE